MAMTKSATQRRIEQLGDGRERYLHKPTGKRYAVTLEIGGTLELDSISGSATYTTREKLNDAEVWERLP